MKPSTAACSPAVPPSATAWVTILTDPDGYKLDFESATDTPEETIYPAS